MSVCELTNTVICFTEKNSKCTYPETDYICNNCQPNSSLKDDYCTCNSGYNGVGYIKCRIGKLLTILYKYWLNYLKQFFK